MEPYFRAWQIDAQGLVREVPFPEDEPLKDWNLDNIYSITPYYEGMFTKRIKHFEVTVFNWKPRNQAAERGLTALIRAAILQDFDAAIIERSGGIDALIARLDWAEWW